MGEAQTTATVTTQQRGQLSTSNSNNPTAAIGSALATATIQQLGKAQDQQQWQA
jgi:phage gpG-like protein